VQISFYSESHFCPGLMVPGFFIGLFVTFRSFVIFGKSEADLLSAEQTGGRMPTDKGIAAVAEMKDIFESSPLVIAAQYSGVDVTGMTGLRQELRSNGARFKIVKNTFARLAADEAGRSELKEVMTGPIGFVVTDGDPAAAAKAFVNYAKSNDLPINIVGGMLDAVVLSADRVNALAKLPSKDELIAKMLGSMNSPITGLVMVMSGPVRALATVLKRHVDNQQSGEAA
jgi:large subunit ribosomal protein L10